jgi:Na+-transporting methylmalonyl-CoA/oxaloacetate decarboxylase gamma subunit
MSAQPVSREVVQGLATGALSFTVNGTAPGAFFAAIGLSALGSLLTLGSLLLFVGIGVVMAVLIALSLSLRRAAHQLPPASFPSEVTVQQKHETRRVYWVLGSIVAALLLQSTLLGSFDHREFIAPTTVFIVGMGFLLTASFGHIRSYYPLGIAHV